MHNIDVDGDFTLLAMLLVLCAIALLLMRGKGPSKPRLVTNIQRVKARNALIVIPIFIVLDIGGLVAFNTSGQSGMVGVNAVLGFGLLFLLFAGWVNLRTLRWWKQQERAGDI